MTHAKTCSGVLYVIAHIRGGGECGKSWHEDEGRYLTKKNTFNDFVDCADHLLKSAVVWQLCVFLIMFDCLFVRAGISSKIGAVGRSAGGLLMGAVVNQSPHLFAAVVADVPFVDVLNTSKCVLLRRMCNSCVLYYLW